MLVAWALHPFDIADPDLAGLAADADLLGHEQRHVAILAHRLDLQVEMAHPHRDSCLSADELVKLCRLAVHALRERVTVLVAAPFCAPVATPRCRRSFSNS